MAEKYNHTCARQVVLGFDFGQQRIGIAVGQQVTGTASAVCTLQSRDGKPDWDTISGLIDEWQPDTLVVGLPLHADGKESEISLAARKFARQLEGRYRLPVYTMDEHLSSHAAAELQNRDRQAAKTGIDAVAARIILQNWLETHTT
jgi:putative Holliday junction resolvase